MKYNNDQGGVSVTQPQIPRIFFQYTPNVRLGAISVEEQCGTRQLNVTIKIRAELSKNSGRTGFRSVRAVVGIVRDEAES
jgi:hypothetical protein